MHAFYEKIQAIQQGDKEMLQNIITDFDPLLRKYGYWTGMEDGYNKLLVFFIELLKKFPIKKFSSEKVGPLVVYIQKSIRNRSFNLRQKSSLETYSKLEDYENSVYDTEAISQVELRDLLQELTDLQYKIIVRSFWRQNSDIEIAAELGISRQAVHRAKQRALQHLKEIWR